MEDFFKINLEKMQILFTFLSQEIILIEIV